MQRIIGISAPSTARVRKIIATLREQLNLVHICMQSPVNRALAGLLNVTEHELTRHIEPHRHYKQFGMNMAEMDQKLCTMVRTGNPLCFIESTEQLLAEHAHRRAERFFNGFIISGIGTHTEADWLRQRGGKLIHIYDMNHRGEFNNQPTNAADIEINAGVATDEFLAQIVATIETEKEAA